MLKGEKAIALLCGAGTEPWTMEELQSKDRNETKSSMKSLIENGGSKFT